MSMWDLVRFVLIYTFLLYIFYIYDAYLEILKLKIYFENCKKVNKKKKMKGVVKYSI